MEPRRLSWAPLPAQPLPGETRETLADGRVRITSAAEPGAELFARPCEICSGLFYEACIARHFDACFTAHSPSATPAVVRQPSTAEEPQRALFGTIFEESQDDGAWRLRLHSLRRSIYMSALPVDCLLSLVGPTAYGRLSQVSTGWRDVTRTARPLRQWHHEQNTRLLDRLVRGERCTCASLVHQLAEGASREVCGKAAVLLERGLALKEVDVIWKTLAGATRQIRLVSRGGDASAILCEATIGDVVEVVHDLEGTPRDQFALYCRVSNRALRHVESPLIVAYTSGRQIYLEMSLTSGRGCLSASLQHWATYIRPSRNIETNDRGEYIGHSTETFLMTKRYQLLSEGLVSFQS